ncbi:MAG: hypothetical protein WBA17_15130 [Saprospiraceae bacterium]
MTPEEKDYFSKDKPNEIPANQPVPPAEDADRQTGDGGKSTDTDAFSQGLVNTGTESIVVFFGPVSSGKTVALLRLVQYLKKHGFRFDISNATPKTGSYAISRAKFSENIDSMSSAVPPRTRGTDFLILDARKESKLQFHLLEAPGEHFFSNTNPDRQDYPRYMNQVFNTDQKKVYVAFFEDSMFGDTNEPSLLRKKYAARLANFVNTKINPKRDKLIILYNKINDSGQRMSGGKVQVKELRDEVFGNSDYKDFSTAIRDNGGGLKSVPLVPFFSGDFQDKNSWAMSPDKYPQAFYNAIDKHLRGSWLW